jgi:hypothetical protein
MRLAELQRKKDLEDIPMNTNELPMMEEQKVGSGQHFVSQNIPTRFSSSTLE